MCMAAFHICWVFACCVRSDISSNVANFVVGGKAVGKKRGRGGRTYGATVKGATPNAKVRSELRPTAQIGKERKKKAGIKARMKKMSGKSNHK